MNVIEALNWRYAAKQMNGNKVPQDKLDNILEAIRLSASSIGLQPYTILNIENPELREKLQVAANNQPQLTQSSNLLVFAAWTEVTEEKVDKYMSDIAVTRGIKVNDLAGFKQMAMGVANMPGDHSVWTAKQAYIALGTALIAAAEQEVDATPMEGFNGEMIDEILGLKAQGLKSVVLLPLGYRDEEKDMLSKAKKVRRSRKELVLDLV
ncbi:NAD(P)H-dependent oxidoreductase [Owenweeksia hongkongensis]|uniref:NAD(P)H-dependent oxidoreductase n=1 Tax=Owenweeksia hongkongensis TaxID=253245 RepID=UPI003A8C991F